MQAGRLFHGQANAAGEDRARVELAYALQRFSNIPACHRVAHSLLGRDPQFAWIQIHALTEDAECDPSPGTESEENPAFLRVVRLAQQQHYILLELRARNLWGAAAIDAGDAKNSWRIYLPTIRKFYAGDYPLMRLYTTLSGLAEAKGNTPRLQHTLLLQREVVSVVELSRARQLVPTERFKLASVAIRAGSLAEAQQQMRLAQNELAVNGGEESVKTLLAEDEMAMTDIYLDRSDPASAAKFLDAAQSHLAGESNSMHHRKYALDRGRLELALGHSQNADKLLTEALIAEEQLSLAGGAMNIAFAQQDRDLYAALAGVWLAQGRSGEDLLALWERYRLRALGVPISACPGKGLTCLQPKLHSALQRLGHDQVLGQVVLFDRVLLYRADSQGVVWTTVRANKADVLAATAPLERAVSSSSTSRDTIDQVARRVGGLLLAGLENSPEPGGQLLLEPDPLLGNLPWPAVETASGPIGLHYDLAEVPSLLLVSSSHASRPGASSASTASALVVGASSASGESAALPEVLEEARTVARFNRNPSLLMGNQATEAQVTAQLASASAIHFAGHAIEEGGSTKLLLAASTSAALHTPATGTSPGKSYLDSNLLRKHPPLLARLAVFSACSSGKKQEDWNHGMGDIVDTLAALGVPEVVATRWQIDSASAVPLMGAFYGSLAQGSSVSHALTMARQTLLRDPRYRHPYYWAAYYASGSGKSDLSQVFRTAR